MPLTVLRHLCHNSAQQETQVAGFTSPTHVGHLSEHSVWRSARQMLGAGAHQLSYRFLGSLCAALPVPPSPLRVPNSASGTLQVSGASASMLLCHLQQRAVSAGVPAVA
jgi:hypothetical protein